MASLERLKPNKRIDAGCEGVHGLPQLAPDYAALPLPVGEASQQPKSLCRTTTSLFDGQLPKDQFAIAFDVFVACPIPIKVAANARMFPMTTVMRTSSTRLWCKTTTINSPRAIHTSGSA